MPKMTRSTLPEELHIPEGRLWSDGLREVVRDRRGRFLLLVWFPAFVAIQMVMLGLAMAAHGTGFDDCDGTVLSGEVVLPSTAELGVCGLIAVTTGAVLALWRLKGWALAVALTAVAASVLPWWILVHPAGSCAP